MRSSFLLALTLTVLGLTASTLWLTRGPEPEPARVQAVPSAGKALIGGDFTLTDQNGKTITAEALKGKLQLVYFGFTHCPDICPTSLVTMTNVLNTLGEKAAQITPVFITVDPARDTPEVLKPYMENFHPSFIGLSGTEAQIKQAADAYKVFYEKPVAQPDAKDYSVNHSGFIYLMDRDGSYITHFRHTDPEQQIVDAITPHLQ